jgi:very-short-patch-repair endonuclease
MATPAHFTREHQRKARRSVSSEACARNGRLGARATIAKHGFERFFESWRKWKLAHPSKPEQIIIGILDDLNLTYEREWRLQPSFLTLDFYFEQQRKGVEFHGRIHGQLKQEQREENDAKKRALLAQAGIECLWIEHTEMNERAALVRKIRAFLTADDRERTPAVIERDLPF